MASALGEAHRKGLIHRDIKPENVIVDGEKKAWLTGFGMASRLARERQEPVSLVETLAGTLAYMAPEQTGRMNRSVDHRSDLYSLGVTLYEMTTGKLPFSANDPLEWVHSHTAIQPVPPIELVDLPEPLSDIIMKLLAKNAEDRYQTAAGLAVDLRHCQTQWDRKSRIDPFSLGANDASDRLLISERLYGRDEDIRVLTSAFDRVVESGIPELVLVSGYSGVGKSSVVNELHKVLVPPRGLFAAGKFDLYKRDIPYATISQAFQSLLRQVLSKTEMELSIWRNKLLEALGQNGQIIIDLIPELEVVIGAQPPIPELSARDAANRFNMVFRRFLGVFASSEHPLALFLDDLQWLDTASVQLLQHLVTAPEVRHVLLVGAYRDNELTASHPLLQTIAYIRKAGASVQEIVLAPLSHADVGHLIEDALRCKPGTSGDLTQFVYEKTGGNPFFVIQFLVELADKSLLTFDAEIGAYNWDITEIQKVGFSADVVHLVTEKLNRLASATKLALKSLACLGNTAQIDTLVRVREQPEQVIHDALWGAVQAGLLLRNGSTYKFLHDRVQEAAYALISKEDRAAVHLKIGRLLASSVKEGDMKEAIFEIVNQFERATGLIASEAEREYVATLFLSAARQARNSTAYNSALRYLHRGRSLLADDSWHRQYALTFEFELRMAECELLIGELANAEKRLETLIGYGTGKLDLASAYRLKITLHVVKSETDRTVEAALECLRLFGVVLEPDPTTRQLDAAFAEIWSTLNELTIEAIAELPRATNPDVEAAMTLLWAPAISKSEAFLGIYLCHIVGFTIANGVTAASTDGIGWFGNFVGHRFGRYSDGYRLTRLACDLVEKHNFTAFRAKALYALYMSRLWFQPISQALEAALDAFAAGSDSGDVLAACGSANAVVLTRFARGDHLEDVGREVEKGISFTNQTGYRDVGKVLLIEQRAVLHLQGRTESFATLDGDGFKESEFEQFLASSRNGLMLFCSWVSKGQSCYMAGRLDEAAYAFEKAEPLYWVCPGHIQHFNYQLFSALTLAALEPGGHPSPERKSRLQTQYEQLGCWAEACPSTFEDKHALLGAEIARIEGRAADAMMLYERAIKSAGNNGFINDEALAHELAARFHFNKGLDTSGHAHLRHSHDCYQRWGAHGKVRQLESIFPSLRENDKIAFSTGANGNSLSNVDILAIFKATQAISREIVIDDLVKTLLTIAVETAGADRGLLILVRSDEPHIVAEAITNNREIAISLRERIASASELPDSLLQYVMRTRQAIILDEATSSPLFSRDVYVRTNKCRSILCAPIVKQGLVSGVLYLENGLTPYAFTLQSLSLLEILASQAAISLETAALYHDLRRSETFLSEGERLSRCGTWSWNLRTGELKWSAEHFRLCGYEPGEVKPSYSLFLDRVHPDDRARLDDIVLAATRVGKTFNCEVRLSLPSGETKTCLSMGRQLAPDSGNGSEYIGTLIDVSDRRRAESALRDAQGELTRVARLTTMGEFAASIAHEVNQPLTAMVISASACLQWLADEKMDVAAARKSANNIIENGHRAGQIIKGIYSLAKKVPSEIRLVDLNYTIQEVLGLMRDEIERQDITVHVQLSEKPASVEGDGVQLQQVIFNLARNSIEAMGSEPTKPRVLKVVSDVHFDGRVEVAIVDSGPGLDASVESRLFEAFVTTKTHGLGMGLSVCRSIVVAHGGHLFGSNNENRGSTFKFTIPPAGHGGVNGAH